MPKHPPPLQPLLSLISVCVIGDRVCGCRYSAGQLLAAAAAGAQGGGAGAGGHAHGAGGAGGAGGGAVIQAPNFSAEEKKSVDNV